MNRKRLAATVLATAAVALFSPKVYGGVDLAPGDLNARDLTPLKCVRQTGGTPVVIVEGDSALPIVYSKKNKDPAAAAKCLQRIIFEMTGVKPLLIAENPAKPATNAPALYIGDTSAAVKAGLVPLKTDDKSECAAHRFRVVAKDGSFYFVGAASYAVYDWCERQLGARCYWPDRPCDLYGTKGTNLIYGTSCIRTRGLAAKPVDYEDQPVFAYRENWPYWGDWMGFAKGGNCHRGGQNVHAPHGWYKDTNLVARLPEIFALSEDGQRATSPLLCYGNPKTLEYYKQRLVDDIEHGKSSGGILNKRLKIVTVSQWDCGVACACEYCKKLFNDKLGSSGEASPIIWGYFTKELAKWLKEKYPEYSI